MREPRIKNKYNLTIRDCKKLKIGDRTKIKSPLFWRNTAIDAWCVSESIGSKDDKRFGTDNSYQIEIYDEDANAYAGKLRIDFSTYGGMCGYNFNMFFREDDVDNELDLLTQEKFLEEINYLIDEGILVREM